jgi:kynurenine formamidase
MPTLVDLTPRLEEGMAINHKYHPRAPVLFINQRHEFIQYFYEHFWAENGPPPLFDGMPPEFAEAPRGRGWVSEHVMIHTHLGTHVDSALHYWEHSPEDAASIPLERCYGDAVILDFRELCQEPYAITIADIEAAERRSGERIHDGDIVIVHTGWASRFGYGPNADREQYGREPQPGLHHDAPAWFIERGVKLVGCDVPNLDYDMHSSAHVNFLCREVIGKPVISIVENLANLERITQSRFTYIGFPLPIVGGSGSPIRAVAVLT